MKRVQKIMRQEMFLALGRILSWNENIFYQLINVFLL